MRVRWALAPLVLLPLLSCESGSLAPGVGTILSLQVQTANFASMADAGVVHVEGASSTTLVIQAGETKTIEGLEPGEYIVALEALLGGQLESFGETNVTVVAGQVSEAALTLHSFTPSFLDVDVEATQGVPFSVQFGAVQGAEGYVIEWDDDASFSTPQSTQGSGTSSDILFSATGTQFVRVRARGPYGNDGIPTAAAAVTVSNEAPVVTIQQPEAGATFAIEDPITFEGSAEDPEDGPITGTSLVWTSNIDGQIGTGASFTISDLSAGLHTITLTATDSGQAMGTDSRSIRVQASEPTVRIGETSTSTASVGDQILLPIVLDLSGTEGAYAVKDIEVRVGFSKVYFGDQTWSVGSAGFQVDPDFNRSSQGETQFGLIQASRASGFTGSGTIALLILDAAAVTVGTATVSVEVVSASDPGDVPISVDLFSEVSHEVTIQASNPTIQLLEPGGSVEGLDGGVLYFRVPVGPPSPAGRTLRVQISGGLPDADLYVKNGEVPTPNDWDCKIFIDGNDERCDQIDAAEGDWFVMIRPFGPGGFSNVRLEAFLFDAVSVVTTALPGGVVGAPYAMTLQAEDGDGTYSWSLEAGDLPPGLEADPDGAIPDGTISGTPTVEGDFTFTVRVVSAGKAAEVELTISVGPAPGPVVFGRGGSAIDPTGARTLR